MEISVTLKFDGKESVAELVKFFGSTLVIAPPKSEPPADVLVPSKPGAGRPKGSANKPKPDVMPAQMALLTPEEIVTVKEVAVAITPLMAKEAIRAVFTAKGAQAALDLLATYGATRVQDVKPEQLEGFIKTCQGVLK